MGIRVSNGPCLPRMERCLGCGISVLKPGNFQEEMVSLLCSQMKMGTDLIKSFSVRMTARWVRGLPQKEASPSGPVSPQRATVGSSGCVEWAGEQGDGFVSVWFTC